VTPVVADGVVLAAGAVCWRLVDGTPQVLLVRRPRHRDVSLPKGKVDPGETLPQTAVREIQEETGLAVHLGAPLGVVEYALPNGRPKAVYYWAAEVSERAVANSTFAANDEIESLEWTTIGAARRSLSYEHDVDVLDRFAELLETGRARTFALVALRHGKAVSPSDWNGSDASRPLLERGRAQASSVAPGIAAFGPVKLVTSTAVRCIATVAPTVQLTGVPAKENDALSQDAFERGEGDVEAVVAKRLRRGVSAVLCSHGPVLPQILAAVGRQTRTADLSALSSAAMLGTAEYAVVHVAADAPESGIVAVEVHGPVR
jgi:8-oxo-(d)GTP phosphatase